MRAFVSIGNDRPSDSLVRTEASNTGLLAAGDHVAVHVANAFDGRDRKRLQRQVKYLLRPPVALDDVTATDHGTVRIALKRPTKRGAWFCELTPRQLLARLAALVPPPRANMLRYRGVFAPRHHLRPAVIERAPGAKNDPHQLSLLEPKGDIEVVAKVSKDPPTPRRIAWMRLLSRVFAVDLSVCPKCSGPMKVLDAVTDPSRVAQMLHEHVDASTRDHGRELARYVDLAGVPASPGLRANASASAVMRDGRGLDARSSRGPPVAQLGLFHQPKNE